MSELADKVESFIKKEFPLLKYLTEQTVTYRGQRLRFDFFIPEFKLYIEVQGRQHTNFVSFFHKSLRSFRQQKLRDEYKTAWCSEQGFVFFEVTYEELEAGLTSKEFRSKVLGAVQEFNKSGS